MAPWYKKWFGSENYLKVYGHRDDIDALKIIDLILRSISLPSNPLVLDAACGAGRHSIRLAENHFTVFAFDLSKALLLKAKERIEEEKSSVFLFRADLRNVCLKRNFDLVVNLFTSFGYFESDDENFAFARGAFGFLNDGGYYVLDYINENFIRNNLVGESFREIEGINVSEKRYIKDGRVEKVIEIEDDTSKARYLESVKLYPPGFVINKFLEIGFKVCNIFGDYDGSDFDELNSERLILIYKK